MSSGEEVKAAARAPAAAVCAPNAFQLLNDGVETRGKQIYERAARAQSLRFSFTLSGTNQEGIFPC